MHVFTLSFFKCSILVEMKPNFKKGAVVASVCSFLCSIRAERVLTSPTVTDFGSWGAWEFCPPPTFVTGMQLLVHPYQGILKDDRGLTGIRLFCNKYGMRQEHHSIKSSIDSKGKWGKEYFCSGVMTGFQVRSEKYRHAFVDDTAANNMRMFCDHNGNMFQQGDGTSFGDWTAKQLCGKYEVVCGVRTQVEKGSSVDLTGVNNIMVKCCDISHPIHKCVPITSWELVTTCDASRDQQDNHCSYSRKLGISYINNYSEYIQMHEKVGYGLMRMINQFQSKFLNVSFDVSFEKLRDDTKDHYWLSSPRYIWESQSTTKGKVTAKKGSKVEIYQIHGKCGMLQIWGTRLKMVEQEGKKAKSNSTSFNDITNENDLDYNLL